MQFRSHLEEVSRAGLCSECPLKCGTHLDFGPPLPPGEAGPLASVHHLLLSLLSAAVTGGHSNVTT